MNTRILMAVAAATIALGVNAAYADGGWDLSRITEGAPQSQVRTVTTPVPAQRAAPVSEATLRSYDAWTYGNG